MSHLGCNSKILWNEIFMQIVDIISVKSEKIGVVICKNFHMIHGELLEIFYSYIQQYSKTNYPINNEKTLLESEAKFNDVREERSESNALGLFGGIPTKGRV